MSVRCRFRVDVLCCVVTTLAFTVVMVHAGDQVRPGASPGEQDGDHDEYTADDAHAVPPGHSPSALTHPQTPPPLAPVPQSIPPPTPPPGTLGQTYQRRSWLIPVGKHPRVAMLDVTVAGASEVRVFNTYQYRLHDELDGFQDPDNPDVWHFESDPLIPGIPHVYRIEAVRHGLDPSLADVRYVRLIRGRRVTLDYLGDVEVMK